MQTREHAHIRIDVRYPTHANSQTRNVYTRYMRISTHPHKRILQLDTAREHATHITHITSYNHSVDTCAAAGRCCIVHSCRPCLSGSVLGRSAACTVLQSDGGR
eukprot:2911580-Pyramimonas_sp.AAC.1